MKKNLQSILFPILFLFSTTTFSQTLSSFDSKLDYLLYENNTYILQYSACLTHLSALLDAGKKIDKYSSSCDPETPWDRVYILDSVFYKELKQKQPTLAAALNKQNEVCKQVVVDVKMERVDKERLAKHFVNFEKSSAAVQAAAVVIIDKWRKEAFKILPKSLADYLNYEYNQFSTLRHYLNENLAGDFPDSLLRKNIRYSDSLLVLIEVAATNSQALRLTKDAVDACQNNKKYFLNNLTFNDRFSSKERNEFYYQIHNHYNNGLVQIVRANYKTPLSLFIPQLPVNNLLAANILRPTLHFKEVQKEVFSGSVKSWGFKDFDALFSTVEALNQAVTSNNENTRALFQLKESIDTRRARGKGKMSMYNKPSLDIGDIEGAIGRLKLNTNEAFPLISKQVSNCLAILEDSKIIFELIQIQIDKELWLQDDFAEIMKLIEQYRLLLLAFDEQLKVLSLNINKANEPKLGGQDSWSKSAQMLQGYCEELRREVLVVEDKTLKKGYKDLYDYAIIPKKYETALEQEIALMTGIIKYGDGHGLCPYGIYEDVLEDGWTQHKLVAAQKDSAILNYLKTYLYAIKYHNEALAYFNKFSGQGAERDSDFAKYHHKTPVVNSLFLFKPALLPVLTLKPLPKKEEPKTDTAKTPIHEMSQGYIQKCKVNNIVFLIDISSSMNSLDKLERFKKNLIHIKSFMRPDDKISIVTFDGKSRVVLKQTAVLEQTKWETIINNLNSSGRTYFNEGLVLAYDYMNEIVNPAYNNRIVLISDGEFEVSSSSMELVKGATAKQISFSALIYNEHATLYPKILDLTTQSTGDYGLIINEEDGAHLLFKEFSVLKE